MSLESRAIYFYGGAGDPILFTFKNYPHADSRANYEYKSTWPAYPGEYVGFDENLKSPMVPPLSMPGPSMS